MFDIYYEMNGEGQILSGDPVLEEDLEYLKRYAAADDLEIKAGLAEQELFGGTILYLIK